MNKFSSYKNQQMLTEGWRKYSSNEDLKPSDLINFLINEAVISSPERLIVPSYEQGEGSFCKVNKQINEYASSAPENLALTIIFVIASQQVNWPVLMAGFGDLADFIETPASKKQVFVSKQGPFVKTWDGFIGASKEETIFPENVGPIVVGKTKAIHNIWMNRDEIFSVIEPLINDYNDSTGLRREDAAFDLYKALLGLQRLGIPKAGFTLQLLIGRYGCIDSINTQLYKNLIPPNLVDPKTNRFLSGSKGKQISPAFSRLTPSLLKIANAYRQFVEVIEAETKNDVSKQLWNTWCDIVAHKINYAGKVKYKSQFDVESPIGAGKVKYDYPTKFASGSERQKYYQLFKNKIGGETVGAQHYIPTIRDLSKQLKLKNLNLKEDSFSSYEKEQVLFENFRNFLDEESEFEGAELDDGTPVCAACLEELLYSERTIIQEAKYQGRTVTLNKPMKGDVKKFKVFVKDPKTGNVKKVNFGDPNMRIKKSNPKRRKSFRARHHCDTNPGPKTKARYWSCRKW